MKSQITEILSRVKPFLKSLFLVLLSIIIGALLSLALKFPINWHFSEVSKSYREGFNAGTASYFDDYQWCMDELFPEVRNKTP